MLLAESIAIVVPCELNRLFFLTTKTYVVARSTKVQLETMNPGRSQSCRREGRPCPEFIGSED